VTRAPKPFLASVESAADPGLAPVVLDARQPQGQAMQGVASLTQQQGSSLGRLAIWAFAALILFVLSVSAHDFVAGLLVRNTVLGWIAFGLVGLACLAAVGLGLREGAAYLRLIRLDDLRHKAETAHSAADLGQARTVVAALSGLYAGRPETAWGLARLSETGSGVLDGDALLALAERELMTPLDAEARAAVEAAARQVALVTALVPLALADVAAALFANLRMIRRIAQIYGGRSGSFGSLRLLRRVFTSLLAAGALALTDDMIGSVAGGGVLSKLSRRFGEGVVNGALTARVGVAAIELCRPMPFVVLEKPAVSGLVSRALGGLFTRNGG
jgi:putative membrane protein